VGGVLSRPPQHRVAGAGGAPRARLRQPRVLLGAGDAVRLSHACHAALKIQRERLFLGMVCKWGFGVGGCCQPALGASSLLPTRALRLGDPRMLRRLQTPSVRRPARLQCSCRGRCWGCSAGRAGWRQHRNAFPACRRLPAALPCPHLLRVSITRSAVLAGPAWCVLWVSVSSRVPSVPGGWLQPARSARAVPRDVPCSGRPGLQEGQPGVSAAKWHLVGVGVALAKADTAKKAEDIREELFLQLEGASSVLLDAAEQSRHRGTALNAPLGDRARCGHAAGMLLERVCLS